MIRYNSQRQLTLEGFETPFEMNLDPSNRWVKYANALPWDDLVKVYCRKMSSKMGAGAKDPRVVIGALFIRHITKLSDEDTIQYYSKKISGLRDNCSKEQFALVTSENALRVFFSQ